MTPRATPAPSLSLADLGRTLEAVLRDLVAEHNRMHALALEHRDALAKADIGALPSITARQEDAMRRIRALELRRSGIADQLMRIPAKTRALTGPARLADLAALLPEPLRATVLALGQELRAGLESLHRLNVAARQAAESIAAHLDGIVNQIGLRSASARMYGRAGVMDATSQVVSGLDVRS